MVVVNDKFEILIEENWYLQQLMNTTSNNKNNKKNCVQHSDTAP